jgi:hypothetical protein
MYHNSADDICVQKMCITLYMCQIILLARRDTVSQKSPMSSQSQVAIEMHGLCEILVILGES